MSAVPPVASLWIGPELSWLEQLCLKSFLDAGHEVTLFVYDRVEGVPDGVRIEPASSFLPADEIVRHARTGSPAYHADRFRLRMIAGSDLIWVDTDAYCVRPFELPDHGHWHGWISDATPQVNNGVLRLPPESETLRLMLEFTADEYPIPPWLPPHKQEEMRALKEQGRGIHVSLQPWGVWGPNALTHFLQKTGEIRFSQPGEVLYPVPFSHKRALLKPGRRRRVEEWVTERTRSIHFWGRRFRAAASDTGGIPPEGSYTAMLLERHGIDPRPTAHLMQPVGRPAAAPIDPSELDFSMFDTADVVNLMLQRSSTVKTRGAVRAWTEGDPGPLTAEAEARRDEILRDAFSEIAAVWQTIRGPLAELAPARLADIDCGHAFVDLLAWRELAPDLLLIDIEEGEARHFGFADEGAAYASLDKARAFLTANGVPEERITTVNPRHRPLEEIGEVDAAISLISCGFHYPARTYDRFFREQVRPGGAIILDIRKGSGGIPYLKRHGLVRVLRKEDKLARVMVTKAAA